jgi:putative peptide zinc metalloprotease protein
MVLAALVVSAATVLAVSSPPGSPTAMARGLSVILGLVVLTAVHEVGHALVIVHAGRRVGPVGVGFYWGSISTYVDATDALLLPRRRRVLQAAAGCIAELGFVAALVLMAEVVGSPTVHWIVRDLVTLVVIDVLINLVPFLELDGYWILTDVLDRPRLRAEARSALRSPVRPGLAAYWIGSTVFGFVLLVGAAVGWWNRFGDVVHDLWFGSSVERVLSVLLVAPLVAPVVLAPLQLLAGRGGSPFDEPPP